MQWSILPKLDRLLSLKFSRAVLSSYVPLYLPEIRKTLSSGNKHNVDMCCTGDRVLEVSKMLTYVKELLLFAISTQFLGSKKCRKPV